MSNELMNEPIFTAKALVASLCHRRASVLENSLSALFRALPAEQQLEVTFELLNCNVRLAATIAARGRLPVAQQATILAALITRSQSNALKAMIQNVFAHRMREQVFVRSIKEYRSEFPTSVNLAAYYFLGAKKANSKVRKALQLLMEETKPTA